LIRFSTNKGLPATCVVSCVSICKTKEWLDTLDDTTRAQYLNECRKESKGLREKCHARLKEIEQGRLLTILAYKYGDHNVQDIHLLHSTHLHLILMSVLQSLGICALLIELEEAIVLQLAYVYEIHD
jgi:hypothetical protein